MTRRRVQRDLEGERDEAERPSVEERIARTVGSMESRLPDELPAAEDLEALRVRMSDMPALAVSDLAREARGLPRLPEGQIDGIATDEIAVLYLHPEDLEELREGAGGRWLPPRDLFAGVAVRTLDTLDRGEVRAIGRDEMPAGVAWRVEGYADKGCCSHCAESRGIRVPDGEQAEFMIALGERCENEFCRCWVEMELPAEEPELP